MQDELAEWIRWSEDDESMFIIKPNAPNFSSQVLKRFFKHGNVSSFVRQLHMYGFHKLPQSSLLSASGAEENDTGLSANSGNVSSKNEVEWKFTHHSHDFCKAASEQQLKRIHRKSNNIGKDGKRRNVLSPVCVSYLGPPQEGVVGSKSPADLSRKSSAPTQAALMAQTSISPVPAMTSSSPLLQQPQPIHQHQLSLPTSVRTPIPQTSLPSAMPAIPATMTGMPLPITSPVPHMLGTPYFSGSPYPSISSNTGMGPSSSASQNQHTIFQYEQNLGILIRAMLQMCDALSADDSNIQENLQRLKLFKLELMTTESNWNMYMSNNPVTAKSSTSVNRFNSLGSIESQKNSVFSNPRLSKAQKISLGGTSSSYADGNGPVPPEYVSSNPYPSVPHTLHPPHMDNQKN
ncbi:unnamed protein product [Kluyveromyces dobzhanskii CBS 2104]|uniref:WGS project CCBQ000000000 data, contig 00058 n=1 Tax=Kluyveromyces dobzhanskii CBS 2104 TaxID=1427455 RepID=A0A0A8LAM7_9SACH|nr:unnamed protein product [Kluyveromyces dobzhanskii CBS 2104]